MNGDQVLNPATTGAKAVLTQSDTAVTLASQEALTAKKVATVGLTGHYNGSNAAPMVFKLAGKTCETFVSSKPGAPSQPVEHLSNGTVQLGPVPTTSTPLPGVSIKHGLAVVKPGVTTRPTATVRPTGTTPAATQTATVPGPTTTTKGPPPSNPPPPSTTPPASDTSSPSPSESTSDPGPIPSAPDDTADAGGTASGGGP
jgi:serine/threonine-protein kinase